MTDAPLSFGSSGYLIMLALLLFARGMDFFSTWVATPTLALEGNPIARKMGWKLGAIVNLILCFAFAFWPIPAVIIATAGILVAAHNFHGAWLMRSLGETEYRRWYIERISEVHLPFYFLCLIGKTGLTALIGVALSLLSPADSIPFAIGMGILAFALIVLFYTVLSVVRMRRRGDENEK